MRYDGIVIGGGAAGMFAAITAANGGRMCCFWKKRPFGQKTADHRQGPLQRDQ